MDIVYSETNKKIKYWSKLKIKKYRDQEELFIVEGDHLVSEALKRNVVKELIAEVDGEIIDYGVPVTYVTKEILTKISSNKSVPNIMAVCYKPKPIELGNRVLLLDEIQDPGNLGTIIRSAVAFNFDSVVLGEGTVDLYNDKVIRSTEGMIFNINVVKGDLKTLIPDLKRQNYKVIGTKMDSKPVKKTIFSSIKIAFIIGNEGKGIDSTILKLCDDFCSIPINSKCESLNAGVAASIIMYEFGGEDYE